MPILNSKRELLHLMPQGTVALFLIQIFSTLSFSVLYSTLVLYMKGKLGLPVSTANSVMGVFIAFNYALHLLGGLWGGRLFSNRALFCIGMIANILGCVLISIGTTSFLYYGLAAFLTGSGLNVTCVNCMVTQRFAPEDSRRETAFLWNYAGMNMGFFIGFSFSGIFQLSQSYQQLFLLASLGNVIALIICFYNWHALADKETIFSKKTKLIQQKGNVWGLVIILMLPCLLSQAFHYANWSRKLVLLTGLAMLFLILYVAKQQSTTEAQNKIKAFAILMIFGSVFWMLYQIGPMGLTVFIDYNVQREYVNLTIPPQWFLNINTIAIVIGGPLLGFTLSKMRKSGIEINIPMQFSLALLSIGLAFIMLPIGIAYANSEGLINPNWIVLCFILQSVGELLISPIGYAMIGFLAPIHLQGMMMGMWMLNSGVGATLSSYSSNLMVVGENNNSPLVTNGSYSQVFLMLGLLAIASSIVLFILIPKLKKLMSEKKWQAEREPGVVFKRVVVCE